MNNNTAVPSIEFSADCSYDALNSVLYLINKGLYSSMNPANPAQEDGWGATFAFHLKDGSKLTGTHFNDHDNNIVIALHDGGTPTGEQVEIDIDDIVRVVYL